MTDWPQDRMIKEDCRPTDPSRRLEELQKANLALLDQMSMLQLAVSATIYKWRQFDEPTLEQRKALYDAYVKSGGKIV